MTHNRYSISFLSGILILFLMTLSWTGCEPKAPSAALIEQAKNQTMAIIDSLDRDENTIIGKVEKMSEFFDEANTKYVINYEIETGLDSSQVIRTSATTFLDKENGRWKYRFVFDKTYRRILN